MREKIKPCPFCNSSVIIRIAPFANTIMFVCPNCGADICFYGAEHNKKEAVKRWNKRNEGIKQ